MKNKKGKEINVKKRRAALAAKGEPKASLNYTPDRNIMKKGGKKVEYATMDDKQHDIRAHKNRKADETAARKRGVDEHYASGGADSTLKSVAPNEERSGAMKAGEKEKERLMRFDYAEPSEFAKYVSKRKKK